jgi:HSP20 family protein
MAKLVPTTKTRAALRSRTRPLPAESDWQPLVALRNAIDRAFDEFTTGWPLGERMFRLRPWAQFPMVIGAAAPATDVIEQDNQFTVAVEMPGMAATDIDVSLSGDLLTVRGEKPETREEKESYRLSERHHGLFQRSFRIPPSVDADRIEARYEEGMLKIVLPKTAEAQRKQRKIDVKTD